jgi:hypothetical protein
MTLEEIKVNIRQLSTAEIVELRDWLEDVADDAEDRLELADEFKAKIEQGERDHLAGRISRIRKPTN